MITLLTKEFINKQFLRFLLAGGTAAAINYGSRFLYSNFWDFELAVVAAFFTGLTSGYLLMRTFVFERSGHTRRREISYFVSVNLLALTQTWVVSVALGSHLLPLFMGISPAQALGHLAGVLSPVFTSFLGHKYLTYRQ